MRQSVLLWRRGLLLLPPPPPPPTHTGCQLCGPLLRSSAPLQSSMK
jgi:hypothetical protein